MKKFFLALGILLISLGTAQTVYAGSLNEYEAEVMDAAQGTFEYKGLEYQLDKAYVNLALEYLMSDDIDLSKEDRDILLQSMNDYIESGVNAGYLVPVAKPVPEASVQLEAGSNSTSAVVTQAASEEVTDKATVSDVATEGTVLPESTVSSGNAEGSKTGEFMDGVLSNPSDGKGSTNSTINTNNADTSTDSNTVSSTDSGIDNTTNSTDSVIIKNTGFNLNTTVMMAIMMGVLMLVGMIVTIKFNFFAHNDE